MCRPVWRARVPEHDNGGLPGGPFRPQSRRIGKRFRGADGWTRLAQGRSGLPCAPRPGRPMTSFSSRELALHTVRLALDKSGEDVRLLQLPKGNGIADFIVIVSGRSDRQVNAIVDDIY